jgi:hypothetical protein
MTSCKLWVSPVNKNKVQQITQMDWIYLYITQEARSLIPLKTNDAYC